LESQENKKTEAQTPTPVQVPGKQVEVSSVAKPDEVLGTKMNVTDGEIAIMISYIDPNILSREGAKEIKKILDK
jgi:ethanolamine utilization microcompartment shell protein EutS